MPDGQVRGGRAPLSARPGIGVERRVLFVVARIRAIGRYDRIFNFSSILNKVVRSSLRMFSLYLLHVLYFYCFVFRELILVFSSFVLFPLLAVYRCILILEDLVILLFAFSKFYCDFAILKVFISCRSKFVKICFPFRDPTTYPLSF